MIKHTVRLLGTIMRLHNVPRCFNHYKSNKINTQNQTHYSSTELRSPQMSIESVMKKIQIAETLIGTELEAKNAELFEEIFEPSFLNSIPGAQFSDELQINLYLLEYGHHMSQKRPDQAMKAAKRFGDFLNKAKQEQTEVRQLAYWDLQLVYYLMMKNLNQKDQDEQIKYIEESIRNREKCIQLLHSIECEKESLKKDIQISVQLNRQEIAKYLMELGTIAATQEMFDESREYFQKAQELFEHDMNGDPLDVDRCKFHVARSYRYSDIQQSITILNDLYQYSNQGNNKELQSFLAMQLFTHKAYANIIDEDLYEKILEEINSGICHDTTALYEFAMVALQYCEQKQCNTSLENCIHAGLSTIENEQPDFITGITKLGKYLLKLPLLSPKRKELLQSCQNKFRSYIGTPDNDETFAKFIMIRSLIDFELIILNGTTLEEAFKTIQQSIYQIIQFQDPEVCVKLIKQTRQYLKERQFKTEEVTRLIDTTLSNYTIENCNSTHLINYIKDSLQK